MNHMETEKYLQNATIRPISASDNPFIGKIIKSNLKKFHLDIPGTAYFDPELDCLSEYYNASPGKSAYFIAVDGHGVIIGGVGVAEFTTFNNCAEIQKLYLSDVAQGKGIGKRLMQTAENFARKAGYRLLYLETHTNLEKAIRLYEKIGFYKIDKPRSALHSAMDRFYVKEL